MKFMNLAEEYCKDDSKFVILPIEYEKDLTYGKGVSKGSSEIINASQHLEYYDEQFDNEPFAEGIKTLESLKLNDLKPEEAMQKIKETVLKNKDKFIVALGGDHSIGIGILEALKGEKFSVLQLDAHPDLFYSWNNSQYNHRCFGQKAQSYAESLVQVGIRSMDVDEKELIEKNDKILCIKARDFQKENQIKKMLDKLEKKVYISIDIDVFDPSFIRNTGTPEPGGLQWQEVIDLLKAVFKEKEVIGADIVEFSPKQNFEAEAYSLAKLAYKIMSLKLKYP